MTFGFGLGFPRGRSASGPALSLNFTAGYLDPQVTFSRGSNATQFDSLGRLVWAPANLIPQSSTAGAVVGVIGSGGALPTGWARSTAAGISHEVTRVTADAIEIRIFGTSSTAGFTFPQITVLSTPLAALSTESYFGQMEVTLVLGSYSGLSTSAGKVNLQYLIGGTYSNEATPSARATSTPALLVSTGVVTTGANNIRLSLNLTVDSLATVDATFRIRFPQLERTGANSPYPYVATTGTAYYGPRFDYNPQTLAARGLLIEESRTNNNTQSDATGAIFVTNTLAPTPLLGWVGSRRITADGSSNNHATNAAAFANAISTVYTISCFVKYVDTQFVQLANTISGSTATDYANFDLINGTVTATGATATATIVNCGGSVYRCTMTFTSIAAPAAGASVVLYLCSTGTDTRAPVNTLTTSVDFFGMQHEQGSYATSLIPTFGTAATRAAESAISAIGIPWFNPAEGTMLAEFEPVSIAATADGVFIIGKNTFGSTTDSLGFISGFGTPAQRRFDATVGGVVSGFAFSNDTAAVIKLAAQYSQPNIARGSKNGGAVGGTTSATIPTGLDRFSLANSGGAYSIWVRKLAYYNTPFTDPQLQALTA